VRPLQDFFRLEAASGGVLLAAAVAALVWANSPGAASYHALFTTPIGFGPGARVALRTVVNDGLMTLFFFVVGMEIKRELVAGELASPRHAALPALAAVGGMVVPSALFLIVNAGGPGWRGWGIPMATDIAFAIACLTLLGRRVPRALVVFLTALAIFDDIGGIIVIAAFYGHGLSARWLAAAGGVTAALYVMNRRGVESAAAYAAGGLALWLTLGHGGIHATLAGVVLGVMVPARARPRDDAARATAPLPRFIHALHPWVAFGVMPLFALANSGLALRQVGAAALVGPVALGVGVGLAVGKPIGILIATLLAVKLRLSALPRGASWPALGGTAILGGIGFTVALFIAALAYPDAPDLLDQAKVGILAGSLIAGLAGTTLLRLLHPAPPDDAGARGPSPPAAPPDAAPPPPPAQSTVDT
jgi:NhaA family Na+:H+ antiporter